jgi:hypothetical protein
MKGEEFGGKKISKKQHEVADQREFHFTMCTVGCIYLTTGSGFSQNDTEGTGKRRCDLTVEWNGK